MEKQSIKITILGRNYSVLAHRDEVAVVQQAAKHINDKIKQFRLEFSSRDELDIALMVSLDIANTLMQKQNEQIQVPQELTQRLTALETVLDLGQYLGDDV